MKPMSVGFALSVAVMVFYAFCTLAEVRWPAQFMEFMNALFHGLDFRKLSTSEPYSWTSFAGALLVMGAWAFAAGSFFAWLVNVLSLGGMRSAVRPLLSLPRRPSSRGRPHRMGK